MISRQRLLEAAMRVFAESGFRGATTRRIAEEAGVNEVTLFRLFKSKTALINEAAQLHAQQRTESALPAQPVDPHAELAEWAATQLTFLRNSRALIRKCMAEYDEHPQMGECMRHGPMLAHAQLRTYALALCECFGLDYRQDLVDVASIMLMGALFADAMGRDFMPEKYPEPERKAGAQYARCFLRAIGVADPDRKRVNARRAVTRRAMRP